MSYYQNQLNLSTATNHNKDTHIFFGLKLLHECNTLHTIKSLLFLAHLAGYPIWEYTYQEVK